MADEKAQIEQLKADNAALQLQLAQGTQTSQIYKVSAKIPPFWPHKPAVWFAIVEAQFEIAGIVTDSTRYSYLVGHLDQRYAQEVEDIITRPPPAGQRYEILKRELIRRLSMSEEERVRQLISDEELGDRRPSQFLRHLRSLAGTTLTDESIVRQLWMRRLPQQVQAILASQQELALDKLAELADKVADVISPKQVFTSSAPNPSEPSDLDKLTQRVEELSRQVCALLSSRPTTRSRSSSPRRSHSSTPSQERVCSCHKKFSLEERFTISSHVVRAATVLVTASPSSLLGALNCNFVVSSAYWVLNITSSSVVAYSTGTTPSTEPTLVGQQGVGYTGLAFLMGMVKDPTPVNGPACKKRWAAGLAGVSKANALPDSYMDTIWQFIVDKKPSLYSSTNVRRELMMKYLASTNRDNEPPIARAVLGQLDLVFKDAYLKSVNLMDMFTTSGSRVLEIPVVLEEVMCLDSELARVKALEGPNYSTCRLIDNNKYPKLNHSNYPNLYAATLEWARRTKKVQKNYLGSKSLIDQAINQDIVRKVLKMATSSVGSSTLKPEHIEWLRVRKGYLVPTTPLADVLSKGPTRRAASVMDSEESESDSEEEREEGSRKRQRTHRRR
ncbi:unnamed protein product [Colias eurytheme]|nr:unnamed protein product [Colias eurytheme]